MNIYHQMSHSGHGAALPLAPLHISTDLQHPQLAPQAVAHHPSLFPAGTPQPHPHPPQLYSGPQAGQQQGGPGPQPQGGAAAANESAEQQQIRLHKHLLMVLKNGSLKTLMENIDAQYVLSETTPQAEDGGNQIASPWVLKQHLIQVIAQMLGDPMGHPVMLAQTLSDFKPAIAEKEAEGTRYIQLRQHREISLSVETDFRLGDPSEEDAEQKKYRIVDEHARTVVARVTAFVESVCPAGRKVISMINRNVVTYFADPGFTTEEVQRVLKGSDEAKNCDCTSCRKIKCHVRFRCIINDNVLAKLLEATAGAPMPYVSSSVGPQNGVGARSPLDVGMASLNISVPPHSVHDPSAGLPYGAYVSLSAMPNTGTETSTVLVGQQPAAAAYSQASLAQMPQTTYYSHVAPQAHTLQSQMFAGQPLLTLNAQQMGPGSAGLSQTGQSSLIGWAAQGQQNQQGNAGGLQSPEYLFQTYNVANITQGFTGSLPSASSAHQHASAHHHYSVQRHASGGGGQGLGRHSAGGPQLAGGMGVGVGGSTGLGGAGGSKGLVSGPQKEKNLPPRLQSQNRQAAAAAAAQGNPANYGYDNFMFNGHSGSYGGRGNGRRGGGAGYARGRPRGSYNHFSHHAGLAQASLPQGGGPSMHPSLPPQAPTPPDLTTDFPHLPGPAGHQPQPQQQQQPVVAQRIAANSATVVATGGAVLLSNVVAPAALSSNATPAVAAPVVAPAADTKGATAASSPLSTYADVVSMHGGESSAGN